MKISPPGWLLTLLVVATACGATPGTDGPPASTGEPSGAASPAPEAGRETLAYDDAGHEMDVYLPSDGEGPVAMVLLVHGVSDDPTPRDHEGFVAWGIRLADAGVVAAVPDHDAVVGGSPGGVAQLRKAVRALRARVAELAPREPPLVTMGFSAGGPDWVEASFDPANQPVAALVGYYAEVEPPRGGPGDGFGSLAGHLATDAKPVLLAYGLQDTAPGILASLRAFRRATRSTEVAAAVLTHPSAGHAFDLLRDDARTRSIIRRTVAHVVSTGEGA